MTSSRESHKCRLQMMDKLYPRKGSIVFGVEQMPAETYEEAVDPLQDIVRNRCLLDARRGGLFSVQHSLVLQITIERSVHNPSTSTSGTLSADILGIMEYIMGQMGIPRITSKAPLRSWRCPRALPSHAVCHEDAVNENEGEGLRAYYEQCIVALQAGKAPD